MGAIASLDATGHHLNAALAEDVIHTCGGTEQSQTAHILEERDLLGALCLDEHVG